MKPIMVFGTLAVLGVLGSSADLGADAEVRVLSPGEALRYAEATAPSLDAARAQEEEAHQAVRQASAVLYPSVDGAAVDSAGFPGSASGLDGFSGLVASPYRKGAGIDAFARWDLIDISTWYGMASARSRREAARQDTLLRRAEVDQRALAAYLSGVDDRGQRDAWDGLAKELASISATVRRYVRNGQYAEVEQILIEDQLENAQTEARTYAGRYDADIGTLAALTGLDAREIACPAPQELGGGEFDGPGASGESPLVEAARLRERAAEEDLSKSRAERAPRVQVAGSVGDLEASRLVPDQDTSLFAGVTVPLFEGFRIDADIRRSAAFRDQEVAQERQALQDLDALVIRYRQRADEARAELSVLVPELVQAKRAVGEARERYATFLGPLADLQQSLKDEVGAENGIAGAKAELLLATGSLRFLFGGGAEGIQ